MTKLNHYESCYDSKLTINDIPIEKLDKESLISLILKFSNIYGEVECIKILLKEFGDWDCAEDSCSTCGHTPNWYKLEI